MHSPRHWLEIPFFVYSANIVVAVSPSIPYFPPFLNCTHFWPLSLEEQYYSVWTLMVFFVRSRRTLFRICVDLSLAIGLRIVLLTLHVSVWGIIYMQLPTRIDSLMFGALLALALRGEESEEWLRPARLRWLATAFAVGFDGVSVQGADIFHDFDSDGFCRLFCMCARPGPHPRDMVQQGR